jgi:SWI/SNF-related matrix-associated actin-dependent regulator 1 of chromatin subfamily A
MVCDFLEELFLTERKVVVWVYHRDVAHAIKERFPTASMVIGGLTTKQRDEQIDRFQTDPDVRLFIGNMDAAGMAISLSAADVDVFAELDYVPSKIDQCEERIWLFDKTNPCTHIKVVVEDSLEERVAELLEMRQEIVRKAISAKALPGSVN